MGNGYIKIKWKTLFIALLLFSYLSCANLFSQERKLGIGIEIGVSSLGDNGTDEYGYSYKTDNTPTHFYSGKHATFDIGFSFQYNKFLLNMCVPIDGSTGENSYGRGDLTENLSGFSMNAGYEFGLYKDIYIYPLIGFSNRANKYSDLYYGKVSTGDARTYFLYGLMMRYKSFYLRGSNDGVSLGYLVTFRIY